MVTLKALEAAVTQVEQIRDHEFTFEAGGIQITLRPLRAEEETDVQRHAQVAWEGVGEEGDVAAYADFMDRVRLATLGYSIVRIGDTDLHGVKYIETGEVDENENPVAVPKNEAVREMIGDQWTKQMLTQVFSKFGELLERVEIEASKSVKFEPADLDEEIDRLEKRMVELKAQRDKKEPAGTSPVQKVQKGVVEAGDARQKIHDRIRSQPGPAGRAAAATKSAQDLQEAVGEIVDDVAPQPSQEAPQQAAPTPAQAPRRPPPQPPQQPQGRRSAIPESAPPPEREAPSEAPEGSQPPQQAAAPPVDQQGITLPHDGDSFFDPADPDAALAAETQRQAELHHRHLQRQRQMEMERRQREAMGLPSETEMARERAEGERQTRLPKATSLDSKTGLRAAANVRDAVFDAGAGQVRSGRPQPQPQPSGAGAPAKLHGKPVYKMPTQTLDRPQTQREHGEPAPSPVKVNAPAGGRQGKFRGPGEQ